MDPNYTILLQLLDRLRPQDLVSMSEGNAAVIRTLKGPLSIGTACSGTDVLLPTIEMVFDELSTRFGESLEVAHMYSCEIKEFKQAFLAAVFQVPVFRD